MTDEEIEQYFSELGRVIPVPLDFGTTKALPASGEGIAIYVGETRWVQASTTPTPAPVPPSAPSIEAYCLCCGTRISYAWEHQAYKCMWRVNLSHCGKTELLRVTEEALADGRVPTTWTAFLSGDTTIK